MLPCYVAGEQVAKVKVQLIRMLMADELIASLI